MPRKLSLIKLLTMLTLLFIFGELAFVVAKLYATGLNKTFSMSASSMDLWHANLIWPVTQYIAGQIILYVVLIYLLWYITTSLQTLFNWQDTAARLLAMILFITTITAVLQANSYYSPHSFYAEIITYHPYVFTISVAMVMGALLLTLIAMLKDLWLAKHVMKHGLLVALATVVIVTAYYNRYTSQTMHLSSATAEHPNIFIIGFDALRPDYLSYFDGHGAETPNFDRVLKQSVVFNDGYAAAARTFASWVSILTGKYPLHSGAREDNIQADTLALGTTLPQYLQQAGYQTVYVSDDNRFNNINQSIFGFEKISGPPGDIADFLISYCNDFPLSNLVLATPVGQLFFPRYYAHHGSAHAYQPQGFVDKIDAELRVQHDKPLFMSVFFNVTGWPFYYFGDRETGFGGMNNLKSVVQVSDQQFGALLQKLEQYGYLQHALLIVLSDHGVTTGVPNERLVHADKYQGNKQNMKKLTYYRYAAAHGTGELGIDTSWGYGSDVLSVKQNHFLLAVRGYGMALPPHRVSGRVTLMDMLPTVLDVLHLPLSTHTQIDGLSLRAQLMGATTVSVSRPFFIESCYSNAVFMREQGTTGQALGNALGNFAILEGSGLIAFNQKMLPAIYAKKQRAVWDGDWLLAQYPAGMRTGLKLLPNHQISFESVKMPPYSVLVNTQTGEWTTELRGRFAAKAPVAKLQAQLAQFYRNDSK